MEVEHDSLFINIIPDLITLHENHIIVTVVKYCLVLQVNVFDFDALRRLSKL
jgi:hypothetical protein